MIKTKKLFIILYLFITLLFPLIIFALGSESGSIIISEPRTGIMHINIDTVGSNQNYFLKLYEKINKDDFIQPDKRKPFKDDIQFYKLEIEGDIHYYKEITDTCITKNLIKYNNFITTISFTPRAKYLAALIDTSSNEIIYGDTKEFDITQTLDFGYIGNNLLNNRNIYNYIKYSFGGIEGLIIIIIMYLISSFIISIIIINTKNFKNNFLYLLPLIIILCIILSYLNWKKLNFIVIIIYNIIILSVTIFLPFSILLKSKKMNLIIKKFNTEKILEFGITIFPMFGFLGTVLGLIIINKNGNIGYETSLSLALRTTFYGILLSIFTNFIKIFTFDKKKKKGKK